MELRRYGSIMWSHRKMIGLLCVVTTLTVLAGTYIFSPWYLATTTVQMQPEARQIAPLDQLRNQGSTNIFPTTIDPMKLLTETESRIITGRAMAERIVLDLGLHKKKEVKEENLFKRGVKAAKKAVVKYLAITWDILKYGRYIKPTPFEGAVEGVKEGLSTKPLLNTSLILIQTQAKDPKTASDIANAAARILVEYRREVIDREDKIYERGIKELLGQRGIELKEAQLALSQYKERGGLVSLDGQTQLKIASLSEAESLLKDVQAQIGAQEARLNKIRKQISREDKNIKSVTTTSGSSKSKTTTSGTPGSESSTSQDSSGSVGNTEETLDINPTYQDLKENSYLMEQEIQALQIRKNELGTTVQGYRDELKGLPQKEWALADLTRNVKVAENSYLRLQGLLDDASIRRNSNLKQIYIVDKAVPPRYFARPVKIKYAGVALLVSLLAGISWAFLREYLNPRIRVAEDAENSLGLPVLSVIPKPRKNGLTG